MFAPSIWRHLLEQRVTYIQFNRIVCSNSRVKETEPAVGLNQTETVISLMLPTVRER